MMPHASLLSSNHNSPSKNATIVNPKLSRPSCVIDPEPCLLPFPLLLLALVLLPPLPRTLALLLPLPLPLILELPLPFTALYGTAVAVRAGPDDPKKYQAVVDP
jgi:hypothetical protein